MTARANASPLSRDGVRADCLIGPTLAPGAAPLRRMWTNRSAALVPRGVAESIEFGP